MCNAVNIILFYRNLYLKQLDEETSMQLFELMDEFKEYDALDFWMKTWKEDPSAVELPENETDKTRGEWHDVHGALYDNYSVKDNYSCPWTK